jgi:hypothetical protein
MWTENPVVVSRIIESFEPLIALLDGMEKLLASVREAAE